MLSSVDEMNEALEAAGSDHRVVQGDYMRLSDVLELIRCLVAKEVAAQIEAKE